MTSVAATMCATLVDEWVSAGVTDAVVCPGSRSTPLALALRRGPNSRFTSSSTSAAQPFSPLAAHLEAVPTVICTTSGTAAAELHAGVVEAHQAKVPLLVCTADRPPELHFVGAPQTIEQDRALPRSDPFGVAPGVADQTTASTWRPLGPGHSPKRSAARSDRARCISTWPFVNHSSPSLTHCPVARGRCVRPRGVEYALAEPLRGRGVIIAGGGAGAPSDTAQLAELARTLGWPLCADPRLGGAHRRHHRGRRRHRAHRPCPSRGRGAARGPLALEGTRRLCPPVRAQRPRVIAVDPWWQWVDPDHVVSEFYALDPDAWVAGALLGQQRAIRVGSNVARDGGLGTGGHRRHLGRELSEPFVARALARRRGPRSGPPLGVGFDAHARPRMVRPRLGASRRRARNRGANGIDGVVDRTGHGRVGVGPLPCSVISPSSTTCRVSSTSLPPRAPSSSSITVVGGVSSSPSK